MARFTGTNRADTLNGFGADDTINGLGGNDKLAASSGRDRVDGGTGNDIISGGDGTDTLFGGAGDDVIYGHSSSDRLSGSGDISVSTAGSGFDSPVVAIAAPGRADRLFVVEKDTSQIKILNTATGQVAATPFLDIPDAQITSGGEQGLLGLTFHPQYASNGRFFVYLVNTEGDLEVREYTRSAGNANQANVGSGKTVIVIPHPDFANHNGGWLDFGRDGYLYIATGDGGGGGDPFNNAQNTNSLLGKILRIDVNTPDPGKAYGIPDSNPFANTGGADEIWALGLRNPWRASFDSATGDLYIGDVGQNAREEVNYQRASSAGGENYGWKVKEGTLVFDNSVPGNPADTSPVLKDPVLDYGHDSAGGRSVAGGVVIRDASGGLKGHYIFADTFSNKFWSFRVVNGKAVDFVERTPELKVTGTALNTIVSFSTDATGQVFAVSLGGTIHKLTFGVTAGDEADVIDAGSGADTVYGGKGDDTLNGNSGNDRLYGNSGLDRLIGGTGRDTLYGGTGDDRLFGNNDADRLDGGAGNDTLTGGLDRDTFVFKARFGSDRITDFTNNIDTISLARALGVTSARDALTNAVQVGADVVFTFDRGETLTVSSTTTSALLDDISIM
jgi:glucose/arabinose dehydrogenase